MDCDIEIGEDMHYEGNCIRPPSEAYSILLQVTLGCSHNKCTFCGAFKEKRFAIKDDNIILSDILFASKYMKRQNRVFLMDGDALIIPQKRLMWILDRIREHIPWVKRVGAYANHKSIRMKTPEELVELKKNGLGILYLGVETGDDKILKKCLQRDHGRKHGQDGQKGQGGRDQAFGYGLAGYCRKGRVSASRQAYGPSAECHGPQLCGRPYRDVQEEYASL